MRKKSGLGMFLLAVASAFAAEDYLSWGSFKNVVIDTRNQTGGARVATDQTSFPVLVRLNAANAAEVFTGSLVTGGGDIRFSRGATHLSYQRERWDAANSLAEFWVLVPTVKGNDTTQIQIYWGKAGVADSSGGTKVFNTNNGFRAVWHMAEGSSPSADATPSGLNAQWQNNPASAAGMIGNGVNLANGAGQGATGLNGKYLTASNGTGGFNMNGTDGITLSFWMRRTGTNTNNTNPVQFMAGRYNYSNGGNRQFGMVTNNAGLISLFYSADGSGDATLSSTQTAANNVWYHVTAAVTASSQRIFINGTQRATAAAAMTSLDQIWPDPFTIGKMDSLADFSQYFNGTLDEIQYSAKAQSADWIKLTYQTQRTDSLCVTLGATVLLPPSNFSYAPNPAIYSQNLVIPNNNPKITGSVAIYSVNPALPVGLTLNATTGVISGTPTSATAAANYAVTATNPGGSATVQLNVTVNASDVLPTNLLYSPNPALYGVNVPLSITPTVTGPVRVYSVNPSLPIGLSLNTSTGVISGTPTVVAVAANYTVTANNNAGSTSVVLNLAIIAPPSGLAYSTPVANYPGSQAIAPNNPILTGAATSWSVSPNLPAGLILNASTGVITGTPSAVTAVRTYTVTAGNAAGSTTGTLTITIYGPPSNLYYSANPIAYYTNALIIPNTPTVTGTILRYSVTPPLPGGLVLDTLTGIITGIPTTPTTGYVTDTVKAHNLAGFTVAVLNIYIQPGTGIFDAKTSNSFLFRMEGTTPLSFELPEGARAEQIIIMDINGRPVWSKSIHESAHFSWDGREKNGQRLVAGVYFVRVQCVGVNGKSRGTVQKQINSAP